MKTIQWNVSITSETQMATLETAKGLPQNEVESHLLIIGILENTKQKHLDMLKTLYSKTVSNDKNNLDL
jgi:hypothetical protein